MNPSRVFIDRPAASLLLALGLLVFGTVAFILLPVAAIPQVDYPTIEVDAAFPGASPETMSTAVAAPLEKQFGWLNGLVGMHSTSTEGNTTINLQFDLSRNIDAAALDVQSAIANAAGDLPRDMPAPPFFYKTNPADHSILLLALTSDTLPIYKVDEYADTVVARHVANIPGVARAFLWDEQKHAVRIEADPIALPARGLSLEDLRRALERTSIDRPKGVIEGPKTAATISGNDQIFDANSYRRVVVAYRDGAAVAVGDVANVRDGVENDKIAGWYDGKPAIILGVRRQAGANTVRTVDAIRAALPALRAALPASVHLDIATDRAETIRASVRDVEFTLILTICLVVMVILLFLRSFWATIIPSVAIPLSLLATFAAMYVFGYTLDNISLMALTISVGFIVDDAIVVIENIVRRIESGESPRAAAYAGTRQVGFTILSITLSLVAVFIPIFFMDGITGRLFREFAVTASVAILVSALVSLSITPSMCARLLKPVGEPAKNRVSAMAEAVFARFARGYRDSLLWTMRRPNLATGAFAAMVVLSVILYGVVSKGFFPPSDNGRIYGFIEAPVDSSFGALSERVRTLAGVVRQDRDVASVIALAGDSGSENSGSLVINLVPRSQGRSGLREVMARIQARAASVPGVHLYMQPEEEIEMGLDVARTEYQYVLTDGNQRELNLWAPKLRAALATIPGLQDVTSDQETGAARIDLEINRELASHLGVDPQAIDDTLDDAFGDRPVTELYADSNQYYVILGLRAPYKTAQDALSLLYVASDTGRQIPLSTFVHVTSSDGPLSVTHDGQFPAVTLTFNLAPGKAIGDALTAIQAMETRIGKPTSLQTRFEGSAHEFESSLASEPWLIAAAILVVYIVLGILYESLIHPLTILSSLAPVGVGSILALMLAGEDLNVIGLIGIILLLGLVKKNAIMMVDFAIGEERDRGMSPEDAIFRAAQLRFRPILMTTFAALFASLPLAFGTGAGSELRHPLGIAIGGGLLVSQVLTLYTTPVLHVRLQQLARRFSIRRSYLGSAGS